MPLPNHSRPLLFAVTALLAVVLIGCGNNGVGTLHPVSGRLLRNNEPIKVNSGYITLIPDTEKGNSTEFEPSGTIDADGSFVVFTKEYSGAPPGWYKVVLSASGNPPKPAAEQSTTRPVAKSLVPSKYRQEATTPLSIEVVENPPKSAYDLNVTD